MATEDHDFAEINHFALFGKTYAWDAPGTGGPVGRLPLTGLAEQVLDQLPAEVPTAFRAAYAGVATLAEATRRLADALFGDYGLVTLDADRPALKQALVPVLERELAGQVSNAAVQATNARLTAAGYKAASIFAANQLVLPHGRRPARTPRTRCQRGRLRGSDHPQQGPLPQPGRAAGTGPAATRKLQPQRGAAAGVPGNCCCPTWPTSAAGPRWRTGFN